MNGIIQNTRSIPSTITSMFRISPDTLRARYICNTFSFNNRDFAVKFKTRVFFPIYFRMRGRLF